MSLVKNNYTGELATQEQWSEDQRQLLGEKNILNEDVLKKYQLAGQIAQTGLAYVESLLAKCLNDEYVDGIPVEEQGLTIGEMCRLGNGFLQNLIDGISKLQQENDKNNQQERGIAMPVRIEKMGFVNGVSPEIGDVFQGGMLNDGDIVKIVLGVHIDGYTAQVAHTVAVKEYTKYKEQSEQEPPVEGRSADAVCAAYLATEAVIALLGITVADPSNPKIGQLLGQAESREITGKHIRRVVEQIANAFKVDIVPGSRVRRVRRYLAGQHDVVHEQDLELKSVEWVEEEQAYEQRLELEAAAAAATNTDGTESPAEAEYKNYMETKNKRDFDVKVVEGEVWLVDIQMCGSPQTVKGRTVIKTFAGYDESGVPPVPTIYSRDVTMRYDLRLANAKSLLAQANAKASVYPFTLSQVTMTSAAREAAEVEAAKNAASGSLKSKSSVPLEIRAARLGLKELVNHHIFVEHPISVAVWEPATIDSTSIVLKQNKKLSSSAKSDDLPVAREMSTVVLIPANISPEGYGQVFRLTGGSTTAQPAYVKSRFEITDEDVLKLLDLLNDKNFGIKIKTVQPASEAEARQVLQAASTKSNSTPKEDEEMEE